MLVASEALQERELSHHLKKILAGVSNRKRYVASYLIEIRCYIDQEKIYLKEHIKETWSDIYKKKGVGSLLRQTLLKDTEKNQTNVEIKMLEDDYYYVPGMHVKQSGVSR